MGKRKKSNWDNMEPQKSSAAQYLTYIASYGITDEKFEIRYEDESIWMSQKMLAAVYGIEVNSVNYHIKKIFADAELDETSVIRKIRITGPDGKDYLVKQSAPAGHPRICYTIHVGRKKDGVGMECMQYTIRDIPGYLDSGIRLYAEKESKSLNLALLDMLTAGLGFFGKHEKNEPLMELAGTWQEDSVADKAFAEMRTAARI